MYVLIGYLPLLFPCAYLMGFFVADTDYIMDKKKFKVSDVDEFFENFGALIWLTYRKEFPKIENSTLTTDCGWGCMLRTGQMILANTLLIHFLKDGMSFFLDAFLSFSYLKSKLILTTLKITVSFNAEATWLRMKDLWI